jgi:uncharacterized protein (TIGR03382 family)
MNKSIMSVVAVAVCAAVGTGASATVALFQGTGFSRGSGIPAGYGNRVSNPTFVQDGWTYGPQYGLTPNVTVEWDVEDTFFWDTQYGGLQDVSYGTLKWRASWIADPGWLVCFHGFDLGGWRETDRLVDLITITDENGAILYQTSNLPVRGAVPDSGPQHTTILFETPLAGQRINVELRFSGDNVGYVGIDNIGWSQNQIPAPGALALIGLGGLVACRRRRA